MERKKKPRRVLSDSMRGRINALFKEGKKVAVESSNTPMRGGRGPSFDVEVFAFQPHNYRLFFRFDRKGFVPPTKEGVYKTPTSMRNKGQGGMVPVEYSLKNSGREDHFDGFWATRIIVRRETVEVISKYSHKSWYEIKAETEEGISEKIEDLLVMIEGKCVEALKRFVCQFGGSSDFKVIRRRLPEHGLKGDAILDSLPEDMIVRDTHFKKVYKQKAEMLGTPALKNYVSNRALERFSPVIAGELKEIKEVIDENRSEFDEVMSLLRSTVEVVKEHSEVNRDSALLLKRLFEGSVSNTNVKSDIRSGDEEKERIDYVG